MFNIKTLNNISDVIYDVLPINLYNVSNNIENPDAIIVRSASMHELELPKSLLAIARAGAGTNNIPVEKCTKAGIAVFNTPGANANAVAELVICSILMTSRNVVDAIEWVKSLKGETDIAKKVESGKSNFVGPEIKNKKIAVIGLGATGINVANSADALGMDVVGYDPFLSVISAWKLSRSVKLVKSLEEAVSGADYVSCHIPLNDNTQDLFNKKIFYLMKDKSCLFNFSRGGLVNMQDIKEALNSGKIFKYITDFPDEFSLELPNTINIPHLGASTPESEENCAVMAAHEIKDYLENGFIQNSVNLPDIALNHVEGMAFIIIHANVPNMVNSISSIISACNININSLINKSKKDAAVTIVDFDVCDADILKNEIEKLENIYRVIKLK